jgi:hypothetical protein
MFDLASALKAAKSGDTLVIPAGDYGDRTIRRISGLTLDAASARFRTLVLSECTDVELRGVVIDFTPDEASVSSTSALRVSSSKGVTISGGKISGGLAVAGVSQDVLPTDPRPGDAILGLPIGRGLTIENSAEVRVRGLEISNFHKGVVLSNVAGLAIVGNDVHDVRTSTIVGGNVSTALIAENRLTKARPWKFGGSGDHGDFIHLWTVPAKQTGPSTDIVIRDNLIDQGEGDAILGIYFDDNRNGLGFAGVVIEANVILNGNAQGVALEQVHGVVRDNVMLQTSGTPKQGPSLLLRTGCDVVVVGNEMPDTYGTVAKAAEGGRYSYNVLRPIAVASAEVLSAVREAWAGEFRATPGQPDNPPEPPPRDELREILARRTVVKREPLKTKGRVSIDFKTPAESDAFLAAVLAVPQA